jgi:putative effector of murein hydrolase LrgA (UPF0299 family)
MIFDLALLLLCQLGGEAPAFWSGLPVPRPVLGLVLLAGLLVALGRAPGGLESTAAGLLRHLSLLFVPAGVAAMILAEKLEQRRSPVARLLRPRAHAGAAGRDLGGGVWAVARLMRAAARVHGGARSLTRARAELEQNKNIQLIASGSDGR